MSNLGILEELNENIKKLIQIFEVYPNPIDEALSYSKPKAKKEVEAVETAPEQVETSEEDVAEETETTEATSKYTLDDLAKKAQDVVRAGKVSELKSKLIELKLKKVTAAEPNQYDELMTYMEGLL